MFAVEIKCRVGSNAEHETKFIIKGLWIKLCYIKIIVMASFAKLFQSSEREAKFYPVENFTASRQLEKFTINFRQKVITDLQHVSSIAWNCRFSHREHCHLRPRDNRKTLFDKQSFRRNNIDQVLLLEITAARQNVSAKVVQGKQVSYDKDSRSITHVRHKLFADCH